MAIAGKVLETWSNNVLLLLCTFGAQNGCANKLHLVDEDCSGALQKQVLKKMVPSGQFLEDFQKKGSSLTFFF